MRRKSLGFTVSALLALFICVGFLLGTAGVRSPAYRYLSVFAEVLGLVRTNYIEDVDQEELLRGAYQGILSGLDPYSSYLEPEEFALMSKEPEGPAGIGAEVIKSGAALVIVAIWPGSPAEGAGLRELDQIWGVDGKPARELGLLQARRLLTGADGSEALIQVYRSRDRKREEIRLRRVVIEAPPFELRTEPGGIGYLRVRDFTRTDPAVLAGQLERMREERVSRLLLDLRGVNRGTMEDALGIAGLFVGEAVVVRSRQRDGEEVEHRSKGPAVWDAPVWLLVDRGTGGAAEILAGALRDRNGSTLLGGRTYGLGARQELVPLPTGDGLVLSVEKYATPDGKVWYGEGIAVDREIPRAAEERASTGPGDAGVDDDQLRRALEIIEEETAEAARAA